MPQSLVVPLVALVLIGWFLRATRLVDRAADHRGASVALMGGMILWVALCSWLGARGFFAQSGGFPAVLVFSAVPVLAMAATLLLSPRVRALVRLLVRRLARRRAIAVQAVRIAAVGVLLAMSNEMPVHVVLLAGVPDLLIGISALYVARNVDRLSDTTLMAWNATGVLIFVVATVAMQLWLGDLTDPPAAHVAASFPWILAPTFIGPMLCLVHVLSLAQVVRRGTPSFG